MTTAKSQAVSLWAAVQATLRAFVCLLKVWTQKTLLTDHPTPLSLRTHTSNPVPYLIYDSKNEVDSGVSKFCEEEAKKTGNYIEKGFTMMDYFLSK